MGRKRQFTKEQVLAIIQRWIIDRGAPPTIKELQRLLEVGSTRTVMRYLGWLEDAGYIERRSGARGLKLLRTNKKGIETVEIPLVGEVPAGPLMIAQENIEGWLRLPKSSLRPSSAKYFLLRVRGDSMNQATIDGGRIENGDLLLVRQQPIAKKGDVIVALIDGEATVKRLDQGPGYYVLKPESANKSHKPIVIDGEFHVAGVACRVFKKGAELITPES
jgi:repressor LexA